MASLKDVLASRTREGELYRRLDNQWVHCYACGHDCRIPPGAVGVCKVRFNEGGRLMVPYGYAGGVQCDPIEKKPFFHVLPGSDALTFGMLGCDYHCGYCQNWVTSQMLRDADAVAMPKKTTPKQLIDIALQHGAPVVASRTIPPRAGVFVATCLFPTGLPGGGRCAKPSGENAHTRAVSITSPDRRRARGMDRCPIRHRMSR